MEIPKITRASFNLTRNCNLFCTYPCFTNGCIPGSMPIEVGKRAIDFLFKGASQCQGADQQVEISFWGGEPFLEWEIMKVLTLYAEAVSKGTAVPVNFSGTTNGLLLTPEKFPFLDEHKIFFMISFDGTKETHDYHRKTKQGFGSHKIVERNLKEVLKKWPFYRVRMSPFAERIDHFYEDCKAIFDLGCNYLMFSPVYESNWTEEKWLIWEEECKKVIDYMKELKDQGRKVEIEHFKSYTKADNSRWPCGSGRTYMHINHEGYLFSCHRGEKFNDPRPYLEQELCLGHIDTGITKPETRQKFIDFHPECEGKGCWGESPCWGGCYMINYEFMGDIAKPYPGLCRYVEMQKQVSNYYRERIMDNEIMQNGSCECYNTMYCGPIDPAKLPKSNVPDVTLNTMMALLQDMNKRLMRLER